MKISVVMSTFNGQKYIEEQLYSIYKQSRQPDEVLIFDDKSNDNTVEIIKLFIQKYELTTWLVKVNKENLGWKKNFWLGLGEASGDIIFLSDQDDIWKSNKIQRMTEEFHLTPKISLLSSGYSPLYSDSNVNRDFGAEAYKNTRTLKKITIDNRYSKGRAGCAFAIKKAFFYKIKNIFNFAIPHDEFLLNCAIFDDSCFELDELLLQHRKFADSVTSTTKRREIKNSQFLIDRRKQNMELMVNWNFMLNELLEKDVFPAASSLIINFVRANEFRINLLKSSNKNILNLFQALIFNNQFYSKKTLLGDYLTDGRIKTSEKCI